MNEDYDVTISLAVHAWCQTLAIGQQQPVLFKQNNKNLDAQMLRFVGLLYLLAKYKRLVQSTVRSQITLSLIVEIGVVLSDVCDDAQLVWHCHRNHIFRIQKCRNAELFQSYLKRL